LFDPWYAVVPVDGVGFGLEPEIGIRLMGAKGAVKALLMYEYNSAKEMRIAMD
jgi:hypothetical protein